MDAERQTGRGHGAYRLREGAPRAPGTSRCRFPEAIGVTGRIVTVEITIDFRVCWPNRRKSWGDD